METPKEIILKAFKEGKTIQSREWSVWVDFIPQNQVDTPNLDYGGIGNWRIKPLNKPHVNFGKIVESAKMETLYRKVVVSERLPEKEKDYFFMERGGFNLELKTYKISQEKFFLNSFNYWLEEIEETQLQKDKEELLEMLEKTKEMLYIPQKPSSLHTIVYDEIESLIQKHKQ